MPRGGVRPGAGAPIGNMNRLKHGRRSRTVALAVERVLRDPYLREALRILAIARQKEDLDLNALADRALQHLGIPQQQDGP